MSGGGGPEHFFTPHPPVNFNFSDFAVTPTPPLIAIIGKIYRDLPPFDLIA